MPDEELDEEPHLQPDESRDQGPDPEIEPEDQRAEDDATMIANAKRRHGALGGVLAAGMLGLDQALGRKPKEEIPVVVASNSDPLDIDKDGIRFDVDDDRSVVAPPLPRRGQQDPAPRRRAKRRRA